MADVVQFQGDQVVPPNDEELEALQAQFTQDQSAGLSQGEAQRVQLMPDTSTLSSAEQEALLKQEQQPAQQQPDKLTIDGDRPAWLPEKFKSPEELASAYQNLEQRLGGGQSPDGKIPEPTSSADATSTGLTEERLTKYTTELRDSGGLSEGSYKELAGSGIPKHVADAYIAGLQAQAQLRVSSLHESVGGRERYGQLVQWATENLTDSEVAAYNRVIDGGDLEQAKLAVTGLAARMGGNVEDAKPAKRVQGRPASFTGIEPYRSNEQLIRDMQTDEYKHDPAFREHVSQRLAVSGDLL